VLLLAAFFAIQLLVVLAFRAVHAPPARASSAAVFVPAPVLLSEEEAAAKDSGCGDGLVRCAGTVVLAVPLPRQRRARAACGRDQPVGGAAAGAAPVVVLVGPVRAGAHRPPPPSLAPVPHHGPRARRGVLRAVLRGAGHGAPPVGSERRRRRQGPGLRGSAGMAARAAALPAVPWLAPLHRVGPDHLGLPPLPGRRRLGRQLPHHARGGQRHPPRHRARPLGRHGRRHSVPDRLPPAHRRRRGRVAAVRLPAAAAQALRVHRRTEVYDQGRLPRDPAGGVPGGGRRVRVAGLRRGKVHQEQHPRPAALHGRPVLPAAARGQLHAPLAVRLHGGRRRAGAVLAPERVPAVRVVPAGRRAGGGLVRVRRPEAAARGVLAAIPESRVRMMWKQVVKLIPRLVYSGAGGDGLGGGMKDAVDIMVDGMVRWAAEQRPCWSKT
jgi:hypothetical protein